MVARFYCLVKCSLYLCPDLSGRCQLQEITPSPSPAHTNIGTVASHHGTEGMDMDMEWEYKIVQVAKLAANEAL